MRCIICKTTDLRKIRIKKIAQTGYKCKACSFIFIWPQPTEKEIEDIYKESYYKSWGVFRGREKPETARLKKAAGVQYLEKIKHYCNQGKLLDIGCAFGYFMEMAQEYNFDVYGVELSHFSSTIAKNKFGPKVFEGKLWDSKFPNGNFDVITMFDLIEHISDPLEFMKEVRRIIKTGKFVAITTPDTGSFSYKILGYRNWFHWKFEHLGYFNKKSIEELGRLAGFSILENKRAYKTISFQYLYHQFHIFPHSLFTPIVKIFGKIIPKSMKNKMFTIPGGEIFVILKAN